ncbi:hypothetical protein [Arthrobacter sp. NPDC092385]|uniref:hypothetical protein n=1 Tax=Arthrobacter sp. NPDC092385 TaxID=3363943 RepID=UPI0037FEDD52
MVHAQDIRHPLGIPTRPSIEALLPVAGFFTAKDFTAKDFTVPSRRNAAGLRLEATDVPFAVGAGRTCAATSSPS